LGEGELNITFSLGDFALTVNVAGWNKHRSSWPSVSNPTPTPPVIFGQFQHWSDGSECQSV